MWALNNSMLPNRATCHVMALGRALGPALGHWVEPWVVGSGVGSLGKALGCWVRHWVSHWALCQASHHHHWVSCWVYYYLGALGLGLGPFRVM